MSTLDLANDRATLLDLYKHIRALMMEIILNEPHPEKYTLGLNILQSADTIAAELSEELNLTAFRRLQEHIREANYQFIYIRVTCYRFIISLSGSSINRSV